MCIVRFTDFMGREGTSTSQVTDGRFRCSVKGSSLFSKCVQGD